MLKSLHIENIAVIRRADLDFESGFSVLTGETGAGKSIIIDSINLLLGNRVPRTLIRTGADSATVSALFEDLSPEACERLSEMGFSAEDGALMLQRRLSADGKSQTRLNGQAITQSLQREIAGMLVTIHGQSDSQKLLQKSTHAALLDAFAHPDAELQAYRTAYRAMRAAEKEMEEIACDDAEKLRMREILEYQIADINAAKLKIGEEDVLEKERDRLANLERINGQSELAYRALRGGEKVSALSLIGRAEGALQALSGLVEGSELLLERLSAAASEIEDIAEIVSGYADDDREDPTARIDRIEGRLETIAKLCRKYGGSIEAVLAFRDRAAARLERISSSEERLAELQNAVKTHKKEATRLAERLTALRRRTAEAIEKDVTEALTFLDMPKVRFAVSITPAELGENGADEIEFLVATNVGEPLMPLIRIASGGELSRVMLALRSVMNDRDGADTVIFDEIDTGVSGKTSRKIGIKLHDAAKGAQVLCVTHSAQIASLADTHFLITKHERDGRAETEVRSLDDEERVEEIARILGGIEVTDVQRDAARQMIGEYRI